MRDEALKVDLESMGRPETGGPKPFPRPETRMIAASVVGIGYRDTMRRLRTGVRAAEGAALEMPCTVFPYRGFESHPVRLFVDGVRLGTLRQTTRQRAVAQLGSAPYWGCGGRRFKSCQPDFDPVASRRGFSLMGF